jgi:predicted DNA-binding transcriptional regulator AlpA
MPAAKTARLFVAFGLGWTFPGCVMHAGRHRKCVRRPIMAATERRLIDLLAYPPRGMDVEHAAAYVGLGRTKFLEMVGAGQFSKPVDLDGSPRWDRCDLDRDFENLKE